MGAVQINLRCAPLRADFQHRQLAAAVHKGDSPRNFAFRFLFRFAARHNLPLPFLYHDQNPSDRPNFGRTFSFPSSIFAVNVPRAYGKATSVQILFRPLEPQRRPGSLWSDDSPRPNLRLETRTTQKTGFRGDDVSRRRCGAGHRWEIRRANQTRVEGA